MREDQQSESNVDSRSNVDPNSEIREIDPETLEMAEDILILNKAVWPVAIKAFKFIARNVLEKIHEEAELAAYDEY